MDAPTIEQVAAILARAPADQPWRFEGPVRHVVRQALCRAGWKWWAADRRAFVLVARARIRNGVRQPAGWDSDLDINSWMELAECPVCDRRFRPRTANHTYCHPRCQDFAQRARIIATKPVHTRCGYCDVILVDPSPRKQFCSNKCQLSAERKRKRAAGTYREHPKWRDYRNEYKRAQRRAALPPRQCLECGAPIDPDSNLARKLCGDACARVRERRLERERKAKLNGHASNGHAHETNGSAADARPNGAGGRERLPEDRAGARGGEARVPGLAAPSAAAGS
jgi:predicted nucleic acid-binding Zn ribbon protein